VVRKLIDNLGSLGLVLAFLGLFNYSVTDLWDWKSQAGVYGGLALVILYTVFNFSRILDALRTRPARLGGTAIATLVLVVGILALLNFLNYRHHKRVDLSEGGVHALSEQSRKVVQGLDQDIQIIGFFQEENAARRFQDLVTEYRYISDRIRFEIVDPQKEPARVAQYDITRDRQVVVTAASGKKEVVDDPNEEKLTNALIKVTRDTEKTVVFLTGHGERSLDDSQAKGYSAIRQAIEKQNYKVVSYNLAVENKLPENASVIVSAGPTVNFFPNEVELLKSFIASGGKFFLLVDPESGFEMGDLLQQYGLKLADDYVVDASGLGQLFGFGAGAPLAADYAAHPITRDLAGTMTIYPGARSVETTSSPEGYVTTVLVRTSRQSWGESDIRREPVSFDPAEDRQGPLALAALATKRIGEGSSPGDNASPQDGSRNQETGDDKPQPRESRVVVFGDSDFASNAYLGTSVNSDLFLNVVSWLAEDVDLLSIRPKDPTNRSVTLTATESRLIFWATVVFFPLAALVFGTAVWYRRR
jgi:ABC-type uncharacterized transport system involved in gliding motility auxiliary subunit